MTPVLIRLFAQTGVWFCSFQLRGSSAEAVAARQNKVHCLRSFVPFQTGPPFPLSWRYKQSSCVLQSQAEIGQRVFKGKSTRRSHAFPPGSRQTGRLEETGAERSWLMLVQGSCCSFSLAPQLQMAGPILLLYFGISQEAPHGLAGGREAEAPRLVCCCWFSQPAPLQGGWISKFGTSPVQGGPQHPDCDQWKKKLVRQTCLQHLSRFS